MKYTLQSFTSMERLRPARNLHELDKSVIAPYVNVNLESPLSSGDYYILYLRSKISGRLYGKPWVFGKPRLISALLSLEQKLYNKGVHVIPIWIFRNAPFIHSIQ